MVLSAWEEKEIGENRYQFPSQATIASAIWG